MTALVSANRPWGRPAGFPPRACADCASPFYPQGPEDRCRPCTRRALEAYARGAREEALEATIIDLSATIERQGQLINRLRRDLALARIELKQSRQAAVQHCED